MENFFNDFAVNAVHNAFVSLNYESNEFIPFHTIHVIGSRYIEDRKTLRVLVGYTMLHIDTNEYQHGEAEFNIDLNGHAEIVYC